MKTSDLVRFAWTGIRIGADGKLHRTGFEANVLGVRISYFQVPVRDALRRGRRLCVEVGPFHNMLTWKPRGE